MMPYKIGIIAKKCEMIQHRPTLVCHIMVWAVQNIHFKYAHWEFFIVPWGFSSLTLRRPLRRKLRMRWFFDIFKVKESSFFKSDLTDPPSYFWCASFGNYRFKPFQISFFNEFHIKIMFLVRWFCSLFERMRLKRKKRSLFTLTNL